MRKKITKSIFVLAGLIFLSGYCMASPKSYYQYVTTYSDTDYPAVAANSSLLLCAYIYDGGDNPKIIVKGEPKYKISGDGIINNWLENTEDIQNWNDKNYQITCAQGPDIDNVHIGLALNDKYAVLVWNHNKGRDNVGYAIGAIKYDKNNIPTGIKWEPGHHTGLGGIWDTNPSVVLDSYDNVAVSYSDDCTTGYAYFSTACGHIEIDDDTGKPVLKEFKRRTLYGMRGGEGWNNDASTGICFMPDRNILTAFSSDEGVIYIGTYDTEYYKKNGYIKTNSALKQTMIENQDKEYPTICTGFNGDYYLSYGSTALIYNFKKVDGKWKFTEFDYRQGTDHQVITTNKRGYLFSAYHNPNDGITVRIYPNGLLSSDEFITSTQPDSNGDYYRLVNDRNIVSKINVKNQERKDNYVLHPSEISVISNQIDGLFAVYQTNIGDQDHLEFLKDGVAKDTKYNINVSSQFVEKPNIIIKKDSDNTDLIDGILCFNYADSDIHTIPFTYDTVNNEIKIGDRCSRFLPTGKNPVLCWLPNNNEFAMFCNGVHNPETLYSRIGKFTDSSDGGVITWHEDYASYFTAPNPSVYSTGSDLYLAHLDDLIYIESAGLNPTGEKFNFRYPPQIMSNTGNYRNPVLLNDKYISYITSAGYIETVDFANPQIAGMQI